MAGEATAEYNPQLDHTSEQFDAGEFFGGLMEEVDAGIAAEKAREEAAENPVETRSDVDDIVIGYLTSDAKPVEEPVKDSIQGRQELSDKLAESKGRLAKINLNGGAVQRTDYSGTPLPKQELYKKLETLADKCFADGYLLRVDAQSFTRLGDDNPVNIDLRIANTGETEGRVEFYIGKSLIKFLSKVDGSLAFIGETARYVGKQIPDYDKMAEAASEAMPDIHGEDSVYKAVFEFGEGGSSVSFEVDLGGVLLYDPRQVVNEAINTKYLGNIPGDTLLGQKEFL